jgi:hypothetical protein
MGKVSLFCVLLVFALLLEDGSSVRKKTEDERKEDEEIAVKVNATLAEEAEKKRKEEEKTKKREIEDETKGKEEQKDKKNGTQVVVQGDQDEACPICNSTCPTVEPCKRCPVEQDCPPSQDCPPCKDCRPCPKQRECPEVKPCRPCPSVDRNMTSPTSTGCHCPEETSGMTVPAALAVGAVVGGVATAVAAAVGLFLRYVPPIVSGSLFICVVLITWFLSSRHPEVAQEAGERIVTVLREATVALGHRIMEAIRHHNDQVCFSVNSIFLF